MTTATALVDSPATGTLTRNETAIPLQHVDTLAPHTTTAIGNGRVTGVAQQLLNYDPEAMVWQDSPHLSLMLSSVVKWTLVAIVWLSALMMLAPFSAMPKAEPVESAQVQKTEKQRAQEKKNARKEGKKAQSARAEEASSGNVGAAAEPGVAQPETAPWYRGLKWVGILVLAYQAYQHLVWALRLKCIKYKMSSQRLIVESGIFSKTSNAYELHQLQSAQVSSPFFLRMYRCANLYVGVWLIGIRNAEAVRDLIRNAGQIEAGRAEKARWR